MIDMGGHTEAVVSAVQALRERSTEGASIQVGLDRGPLHTLQRCTHHLSAKQGSRHQPQVMLDPLLYILTGWHFK